MNIYGLVILAALILGRAVSWFADWLNLGALRNELPSGLEGVYDAEAYRRSQRYTRERTLFGYVTSSVDLLMLVGFWLVGGFDMLDQWLRGFAFGPVVTGLLFIGILMLLKIVVGLPVSIYSTFVIEQRYGFNRTTARTFVADLAKSLVLGAILAGPLLALVLWLFESRGTDAWLICWLATTLFSLLLQYIFPTWILPLFNRFEPLADGELRQQLSAYARSAGFALGGIFIMDGSRRSNRSNAFFTGFGRTKRIALFDTLVERHTVPELVAILAHEVGHAKKHHLRSLMMLGIASNGLIFFLLSRCLEHRGLFDAFFMADTSVYASLVFFALLYTPIDMALSLAVNAMSRRHEYEADRWAAKTAHPEAMATALEKLSSNNLSNLTPHPFYVALNHSHPPVMARVDEIRRVARGEVPGLLADPS